MNIRKNCTSCDLNTKSEKTFLCNDCKLVFQSYYTSNHSEEEDALSNLPHQSIYFHANESILKERETNPFFKGKNILLIGTGSIKRLPILASIKQSQFNKIVCLCTTKNWAYQHVDDWILAEHENLDKKEETYHQVVQYIETNQLQFDAILTYDDLCCLMTSFLSERFNLPGIPFEISQKIKNKYEFRKKCQELDISHPNFFMIQSSERESYVKSLQLSESLCVSSTDKQKQCKFPLIVKNTLGTGKDFVTKCQTLDEYVQVIDKSLKYDMNLLIEEFFEGHEIDCEILVQDNKVKFLAISDNFPPLEPFFFEQGGTTPSIRLSKEEKQAIEYLISKWVSVWNLENGCLHFEARCRPQSIYQKANFDENSNLIDERYFLMPIEINMRPGGAETWSMIKSAYDVDLIQELLKTSLKIQLDERSLRWKLEHPRFQCISRDFHPARNVFINSIQIKQNELIQNSDLVELCLFRSVGEKLTTANNMGWMSVKHNDVNCSYEELKTKLDNILNLLQFHLIDYQ